MGEPRDFKYGTLTHHGKFHPADEKSSLKGAWSGSGDPFLEFYTPCNISATATARLQIFYASWPEIFGVRKIESLIYRVGLFV